MGVVTRDGKTAGPNTPQTNPNQVAGNGNIIPPATDSGLVSVTLEDLKRKNVIGAPTTFDYEEDAWERSAPPPKGRYALKIFLGQEGLQLGYLNPKVPKENEVFITAPLQCKIVSDDLDVDGQMVFPRVSTRMYRGKSINTMMGLIVKALGPKAIPKAQLTVYEQAQLFTNFLKKEPIVEADLDWRASYKDVDGKWVNAIKTYDDFPNDPSDPTGNTKLHIVDVTRKDGGTETVTAQLQVDHWYAKGEQSREQKKGAGGIGAPVQMVMPGAGGNAVVGMQGPLTPMPQHIPHIPQPITNPTPTPAPAPVPAPVQTVRQSQVPQQQPQQQQPQVSDDDLALILGE